MKRSQECLHMKMMCAFLEFDSSAHLLQMDFTGKKSHLSAQDMQLTSAVCKIQVMDIWTMSKVGETHLERMLYA